MNPPAGRYTPTAIALHWLLGIAIICTFCLGLYMTGLPFSPQRMKFYNWHKWAGICILALSAVRLLWRLTHRPPADLPMPAWQATVAHWTHRLLYVFFFAVPLIGWIYSSSAGFPVVLFGVWTLPDLVGVDKAFAESLKPWHAYAAYGLAILVLGHIAGALKHHFIDRDKLLSRMLPGR